MNLSIKSIEFNETITNQLNNYFVVNDLPSVCNVKGTYSLECIYDYICPQFTDYFINMGLIIIIVNIVVWWFLWWTFKYGYKYYTYDESNKFKKFIGNLWLKDTRIFWDTWVRTRLSKLSLGYIAVVVWLSINASL